MIKLPISQIGQDFLHYQDILANTYKYKQQPNDVAEENYEKYYNNLPECFKLQKQSNVFNEICKAGYSVTFGSMPIISREGLEIAKSYDRIVIGQYGAFIEIDDKYINKDNIKVKPGQEYRIHDPKYKDNVKYQWFTTKDDTNCKLYYQQKGVCYADYLPGKWYISPYEVLTDIEIEQYLSEDKSKNSLFGIEEDIIDLDFN